MFWGLIMQPNRRYTQTVEKPFHVSKAALDINNSNDEPAQLILSINGKNYLLCTLQKDRILQCSLNLNFNVGDVICFSANGQCNIHLSGYLVEDDFEEDDELSEDEEIPNLVGQKRKGAIPNNQTLKKSKTEQLLDEDYDSEDDTTFNLQEEDEDDEEGASDSDEELDDEEDEDANVEEDENEESSLSEEEIKTQKINNKKVPVNGLSPKPNEKKSKKQKQKEQKNQQQNIEKPPKPDTPSRTPKIIKTENSEQNQVSQKRSLEGGVIVQDLKEGTGAVVKSGKMVQVYYEGRLKTNNKMFDSNKQGPGFKFRVAKQEVIKGWDIGVLGMKVGGKRRITCPPHMAYGQKGSPPVIPPNSTLVFEVEVKNVQ